MINDVFKHLKIHICFLVVLFILFLVFGVFVPVRLIVTDISSPWYGDMRLTSDTSSIYTVSLFGVRYDVKNACVKQSSDGSYIVMLGDLVETGKLDIIKPNDTKFEYDGNVYVGQSLDASKLKVVAMYDDCERNVTNFSVTSDVIPMSSSTKIPVVTNYGVIDFKVKPVLPKSVSAKYIVDTKMGDVFDKSNVVVSLNYEDGTTYDIDDFIISDAPKYILDNVNINVITDYGNVVLNIIPKDAQTLKVSYDGPVYVGDLVDSSKIHLSGLTSDGDTYDITDFTIDYDGIVKTNLRVVVHSKLGDSVLNIEPIKIKKCEAILDNDIVVGDKVEVSSVNIIYEDDRVVNVPVSDIKFTNSSLTYTVDDMIVWFMYKGLYCNFKIATIPADIVKMRGGDSNISTISTKYDLSDSQISTIAILCQRLASDNVEIAAAEASLMANRYELYSNNNATDGDSFISYIISSGYWGDDVMSYVEDYTALDSIKSIVKTVLVDGYRVLPENVDERKNKSDFMMNESDVGIMTSGTTVLTDETNMQYIFYSYPSSDYNIIYCVKKK